MDCPRCGNDRFGGTTGDMCACGYMLHTSGSYSFDCGAITIFVYPQQNRSVIVLHTSSIGTSSSQAKRPSIDLPGNIIPASFNDSDYLDKLILLA